MVSQRVGHDRVIMHTYRIQKKEKHLVIFQRQFLFKQ